MAATSRSVREGIGAFLGDGDPFALFRRKSDRPAPEADAGEAIDDDELADGIADADPRAGSPHQGAPVIGSTRIIRLSEIGRR